MTALSDPDLLLAAILANPEDDAPRLALADWLDEHAGTTDRPCPTCQPYHDDPANPWGAQPGYHPERDSASGRHEGGWSNCKTCNGGGNPKAIRAGVIRESNGHADRAAFIRVQCELARLDDCGHDEKGEVWLDGSCRVCPLRRRERRLWHRLPTCKTFAPWASGISTMPDYPTFWIGDQSGPRLTVRRGFVERVACDLRTFLGGPCERCRRRGTDTTDALNWEWDNCPHCKGTGRTTGIAAGLAAQPVTAVVLTCREPWASRSGRIQASWYCREPQFGHGDDVPPVLFDLLDGGELHGGPGTARGRFYDSADTAHTALALAAANHVRSLAPTTHRAPCPTCKGTRRQRVHTWDPASDTDRPSGNWNCRDCDDGWVTRPGLMPLTAG